MPAEFGPIRARLEAVEKQRLAGAEAPINGRLPRHAHGSRSDPGRCSRITPAHRPPALRRHDAAPPAVGIDRKRFDPRRRMVDAALSVVAPELAAPASSDRGATVAIDHLGEAIAAPVRVGPIRTSLLQIRTRIERCSLGEKPVPRVP